MTDIVLKVTLTAALMYWVVYFLDSALTAARVHMEPWVETMIAIIASLSLIVTAGGAFTLVWIW